MVWGGLEDWWASMGLGLADRVFEGSFLAGSLFRGLLVCICIRQSALRLEFWCGW